MHNEPLKYSFTPGQQDGTTILKLDGPLTLSSMFALQDELRTMKPQFLIVDLSDSPYMDSAGLGLVMNTYVSAEHNGRKLVLAGTSARIRALLEMTKVDGVLKNYNTVEEAEASL
ncbi:STAS domain-containing protein [Edaphobacter sp. HDX4]|uniref:STAS domain-containing protein n=1 Tax=Edaphobacter sp. HDX4 TaxID=2794064 RepID=UPI002FE64EB3